MKKNFVIFFIIMTFIFAAGCLQGKEEPLKTPVPEATAVEQPVDTGNTEPVDTEVTTGNTEEPADTETTENTEEPDETEQPDNTNKTKTETWAGSGSGQYEIILVDLPVKIDWEMELKDVTLNVYEDSSLDGQGKIILKEEQIRDVVLFRKYEITDETIKSMTGKITDEKLKILEGMKGQEFSQNDLIKSLETGDFSEEEIDLALNNAKTYEGDKLNLIWSGSEFDFSFSGKKDGEKYIIDKFWKSSGRMKSEGPNVYNPEYDVPLIYTASPVEGEGYDYLQFTHEEENSPKEAEEMKGSFTMEFRKS